MVQVRGPLGLVRGALLVTVDAFWVMVAVSHCWTWMAQSLPGQVPGCFFQLQDSGSEPLEGLSYYPFMLRILQSACQWPQPECFSWDLDDAAAMLVPPSWQPCSHEDVLSASREVPGLQQPAWLIPQCALSPLPIVYAVGDFQVPRLGHTFQVL